MAGDVASGHDGREGGWNIKKGREPDASSRGVMARKERASMDRVTLSVSIRERGSSLRGGEEVESGGFGGGEGNKD